MLGGWVNIVLPFFSDPDKNDFKQAQEQPWSTSVYLGPCDQMKLDNILLVPEIKFVLETKPYVDYTNDNLQVSFCLFQSKIIVAYVF